MKSRSLFSALAVLIVLVVVPSAFAGLPQTKSKLIVPGESVAGVKLGMSMAKAGNVWKLEEGKSCFELFAGSLTCMFELVPSSANYNTGNISYSGVKKVEQITIVAPGVRGERPILNSQMNKYKTKDGVGIGATLGKLRGVFGAKLKLTEPGSLERVFKVAGPGKAATEFSLYGSQVRAITLKASP